MLQMWTLSVQRQIPWHTMLTFDYTANRVTHLSGYNINPIEQPNPSVLPYGSVLTDKITANLTGTACAGITAPYANFASKFGGGATVYQALKPFPQYSNVARACDQVGTTYFSAFQIQADKHMSNNLNFLANIELPRLYDNMATAVNKYNPQQLWAEDTTGSFESKFAGTYELPFGRGQRWLNSGRTGNYMGGWQVAAILTTTTPSHWRLRRVAKASSTGPIVPTSTPMSRCGRATTANITKFFEDKLCRRHCCSAPVHGPTPAASMCWATPTRL